MLGVKIWMSVLYVEYMLFLIDIGKVNISNGLPTKRKTKHTL